ncbi:hypothetical protein I4U23_015592 [Adineta vaga]|nr:hypothetical protein I4U23_015592 [Adineta vaga]
MSKINIQIGNDLIKGKSVGSNHWQFWFNGKQFSIDSPDAKYDTIEILTDGAITLQGKQIHGNVWKAEHSFYGSSAWGTIFIRYTLEFNTESMKTTVQSETNVDA